MKSNKLPIITAALCIILAPVVCIGWLYFRLQEKPVESNSTSSGIESEATDEYQRELPWTGITDEVSDLLKDIQRQKADLEKREESLKEREDRLAAETVELEKVRQELVVIRKDIDTVMIKMTVSEISNLKPLVQMCSNLSPKSAIALLKEMPEETSIKILHLMKEDVVTGIIEEMTKGAKEGSAPLATAANWLEKLRLLQEQSK